MNFENKALEAEDAWQTRLESILNDELPRGSGHLAFVPFLREAYEAGARDMRAECETVCDDTVLPNFTELGNGCNRDIGPHDAVRICVENIRAIPIHGESE